MEIKKVDFDFSVCKVPDFSDIDLEDEYCFIGKTEEERCLSCNRHKNKGCFYQV